MKSGRGEAMKETKKEISIFSYYDCTGIENHLKKMAEKGWMLEEITGRNWKYRRIEPRSMSFFVSYYPQKVSFDDTSAERLKYIDENSVAGWKFVTHVGKMHIFCNESENPVPLHTDAAARVKEIHRFAKTNMILENLFLLAVVVAVTTFLPSDFLENLSIQCPMRHTYSGQCLLPYLCPFTVFSSIFSGISKQKKRQRTAFLPKQNGFSTMLIVIFLFILQLQFLKFTPSFHRLR